LPLAIRRTCWLTWRSLMTNSRYSKNWNVSTNECTLRLVCLLGWFVPCPFLLVKRECRCLYPDWMLNHKPVALLSWNINISSHIRLFRSGSQLQLQGKGPLNSSTSSFSFRLVSYATKSVPPQSNASTKQSPAIACKMAHSQSGACTMPMDSLAGSSRQLTNVSQYLYFFFIFDYYSSISWRRTFIERRRYV
jgi:hypothetical protein